VSKPRPIQGVIPVLSTPFTAAGEVDEPALRRLVDFLAGKEIGGLWVLGTGSEDMNLSYDKRLQVARIVTDQNAGRLPLVVGAGFFALEDILRFAEEVKDLDFEYYHVMPYHTLLSFERLEWFYRHIADRLAKPLWMYTSANWSKPFTPEFVASLKGHPNIAGVKYSTKDAVNILKVAALQDEEFQVITAVASQFAACLGMGVKGHTSSLGSAVPEAMIAVYKAFREQGQEAALQEQQRLNAFLSEWPKGGKSNNFLQAAEEKAILELRGICKRHTSSYYAEMDDAGVAALKRVMEKYGYPLAS
jgi:4-hydroxy-tetrahydrodipicolinate synthase